MPFASRAILGALTASFCFAWAAPASADVQACLNASEKGQKLRSSGNLRAARENFVICGAEACPALIRHDCSQWNTELAAMLPTVVFGAKDKAGKDLFDVTVSIDGEVLTKKLDGKSVIVDPGKHVFKFESAGLPPITETDLVKEGEKARVINITFESGEPVTKPPPPPPTTGVTGPQQPGPGADRGGHSIPPWILVGVGGAALIAGIVILVTTPDRPSNCNKDTQRCTKTPGESEADLASDKDQAGTADSQPVLGAIIGGAGLALVAGGLVWHFLEPTSEKSALKVRPWTTGRSSGLSLGATF